MANDEGIEALRRKKLIELKQQMALERQNIQAEQQIEMQKQAILRKILTTDARQRLTNLKMVKPEFESQLELQLIQLTQLGRISTPITDEQLKDILVRLQSRRRDIKIRRV